ncbi:2(OG)-Fe(II) oxygenase superfamily protein [Nitzschia inconspicua]|uniref:2(OG)-Fe(II) oxygenase superfamily protein n=1 Tax=Nitzschia inconspicua TaxID=303405 RepID=A0A9K3L5Z1_9STRA|nr:2(OG)-Fe(II) oxygenase superfamily protein [Nitzschia inconspicua]
MIERRIVAGLIGSRRRTQCHAETRRWTVPSIPSSSHVCRPLSNSSAAFQPILPDLSLVDARKAPIGFEPSFAVVYRDFVSPQEADVLVEDVLGRMKRRRYEKGHWDAVITGYKEVELHDDSFASGTVLEMFDRTRQHLEQRHLQDFDPVHWLPCHAIDLKKDGELKAHVDSVRFSGELVAGISLLSSCIMRLVPDAGDENSEQDSACCDQGYVDLLLPPNSLYALTGDGRYKYSHQLLPDSSVFTSPTDGTEILVKRDHRLSIIFRDAKREEKLHSN